MTKEERKKEYFHNYYLDHKNKWEERRREDYLNFKHGISKKKYKEMYNQQNGMCLICSQKIDFKGRGTHVDHSHKTGKIRGLLCLNCNTGIGKFKENITVLRNAVLYLTERD